MKKKIVNLVIILMFCMTFLLNGCGSKIQNPKKTSSQIIVTDALNREVKINGTAKRVVAIGPGALRLCCYFNNPSIFVGIEQMEVNKPIGRPYIYANPELKKLPIIGAGGPNNAPNTEKLLAVKPDVIFTTYANDKSLVNNLQSQTGIPVIALSYGKTSTFDPKVNESLLIIGKTIGMNKRAQEVVKTINEFKTDLDIRTKNIEQDKKPSVYIGGLGMKGSHGIESTQGNYSLFNAIHAKNVADETGKTGSLMVDKEQLIKWNPNKIFIDSAGYPSVIKDYKKNEKFYKTLSAISNKQVYLILPYNFYTTNIDTSIADAYYMGKMLYPEQFKDVDPIKKANEIYKLFLGKEVYEQISKDFGGFKQVTLK